MMTKKQRDLISDLIEIPVKYPIQWFLTTVAIGVIFFSAMYYFGI